ncbi:UNVERIFIED_CONTAM: hypothetical protein FKN15_017632 [Acipenser sinensis]
MCLRNISATALKSDPRSLLLHRALHAQPLLERWLHSHPMALCQGIPDNAPGKLAHAGNPLHGLPHLPLLCTRETSPCRKPSSWSSSSSSASPSPPPRKKKSRCSKRSADSELMEKLWAAVSHQEMVLAELVRERLGPTVPLDRGTEWQQEDMLSIATFDEVGEQELAYPSEDVSAERLPLIKRATAVLQVPWPTQELVRERLGPTVPLDRGTEWQQEDMLSIATFDEVGEQELAYPSEDVSAERLPLIKRATAVLQVPWPTQEVIANVIITSDGTNAVGSIVVSQLKMGEIEDGEVDQIATDAQGQKCSLICESASHRTTNDKDNSHLMNAVFKNPVCKVYRFQTVDRKWMFIREQMAECTLSFNIPKQLMTLYIQEDMRRIQELKELGDLSPHWDNLRKEVITHYGQIISSYQETLAELNKLTGSSFKPSISKAEKYLEFIPINLHTQRMRVNCPRKTDAAYDVITVGAPAAHFQGFKHGGLHRLLSRFEVEKKNFSTAYQCIYYSPENTSKAKEVLTIISLLQPLISSLGDQLLHSAQQHSSDSLKEALKTLSDKTEQFVHVLKDELVKNALLALYTARPGYVRQGLGECSNELELHHCHGGQATRA